MSTVEQNQRIQEFMAREFRWTLTAGECNFLVQLLVHLVQENPPVAMSQKGEKERLNYQSIRTIVLLNEKLSGQLQRYAEESSIVMAEVKNPPERVQ